ncbi:GNAT family N-acetyltransferase [Cryobacterium serini]|uniref:N-acetyltransferase domain-containing protein n=1 Tax=Cryobacterium serini TaxID=1259201 RepID=A0A4R9BSJ6_9MICO|nr:GNAT family N-acetyltransferase [Cryobacterium serini]TFD90101.1 hypothetical protein E3T51_05240 [Cryobacterium serini]
MAASVRFARSRDLDAFEKIENDADRLLINKLQPDDWAAAPTGVARASEPGFILVVELDDGHVAGFVHVLEVDDICHLEQLSVAPGDARKGWGRALGFALCVAVVLSAIPSRRWAGAAVTAR